MIGGEWKRPERDRQSPLLVRFRLYRWFWADNCRSGCIGEIHLALAAFAVSTHPSNDVAKVCRLKRINHRAAQFYPFEHLKTLGYFQ